MKSNILFVNEKYCDGSPDVGFSNSFHNLFNTFEQSRPDFNLTTLHLDESESIYGVHLDTILPDYCVKFNIKIIQFCMMNGSKGNPSIECLKKLKNLGIFLCFHWPDTGPGWGIQTIQSLNGIADLHISWDNPHSPYHDGLVNEKNHLSLWVPQDKLLYYPQEQDISISFIGSPRYQDRGFLLGHLLKSYPDILIKGGQREDKLSPHQYAAYIRRSKIGINFSLSPAMFYQTKGRIFEIVASKSMLFEFKNPATEKLFEVGVDYVDFNSTTEMIDKIKYYITHEEERAQIAQNGFDKFQKKYTAQIFWDTIIDRINSDLSKSNTII